MEKVNRIVGVLVVVAVVALAGLSAVDNLTGMFGKETYKVGGTFTNIGGLTLNSPVQIGGVVIGHVEHLRFTADGMIYVTLRLQMRTPIPVDSVMSVGSTLVSGDTFVNLYRGTSKEMIKRTRDEKSMPMLRSINYFGLADLGESFANIGKAVGETVDNFSQLIGRRGEMLKRINEIHLNGDEIRGVIARIADRFADENKKCGEMSDRMLTITGIGERWSQMARQNFPAAARWQVSGGLVTIANDMKMVQETQRDNGKISEQINNDLGKITAWAAAAGYSPRSVVGVLLSDPDYSAEATVRELKAAYYSVMDKPLLAKVMLGVRHFIRAKSIVGDFSGRAAFSGARAEDFHKAWMRHAHREKSLNGYITTGK